MSWGMHMYSYPYLIRKLDEECPPGQCGSRNLALIALALIINLPTVSYFGTVIQFSCSYLYIVGTLNNSNDLWNWLYKCLIWSHAPYFWICWRYITYTGAFLYLWLTMHLDLPWIYFCIFAFFFYYLNWGWDSRGCRIYQNL